MGIRDFIVHLEREFQVFASPDVKARIVSAQLFKELFVDGEKASCHGGRVDRLCAGLVPVAFPLGHRVPVELQVPVESTDIDP